MFVYVRLIPPATCCISANVPQWLCRRCVRVALSNCNLRIALKVNSIINKPQLLPLAVLHSCSRHFVSSLIFLSLSAVVCAGFQLTSLVERGEDIPVVVTRMWLTLILFADNFFHLKSSNLRFCLLSFWQMQCWLQWWAEIERALAWSSVQDWPFCQSELVPFLTSSITLSLCTNLEQESQSFIHTFLHSKMCTHRSLHLSFLAARRWVFSIHRTFQGSFTAVTHCTYTAICLRLLLHLPACSESWT